VKRLQLDLRGEVCPYTFLRAKLALEELADGDELILRLDHRPAYSSVPRALRQDGHAVVSIEPSPDGKECVITARCQAARPPGA
jgi:tRNA 2-thiouridine synthesizing protein A